ncbi:glycosyltransferase [Paenarthrobacter sp. C1]|uniref:glycosyltransferase n=1 Tax=Paenarthrobacter sp. C1 TaxID=3400220 RepID=UPI003BF4D5EC
MKSDELAIYLTVLPFYRQACMEALTDLSPSPVALFAGPQQLGGSVRTGIGKELYTPLRSLTVLNRAFFLTGHLTHAVRAKSLILDLNPRCLSAWILLGLRRVLGKRTLVWGHLHPRAGASSRTAGLRRLMRSLAHGTVLYGYDSVQPARKELPNQPVWVAPNALYNERDITPPSRQSEANEILYVGRLVTEKKVDLLIRAFAVFARINTEAHLTIIGEGEERAGLEQLARSLGCVARIKFKGAVTSVTDLRSAYAKARFSVSPGYVGLSLTQSLGFGTPMLVANDEPHAPEIELEKFGGVIRFTENDPEALAACMNNLWLNDGLPSRESLASSVRSFYSAETMAQGLLSSLVNETQQLNKEGWPREVNEQ